MKSKKRFTPFSAEQKLKELHDYQAALMPVNDMDLIFKDLSSVRREKTVDGDDPFMELMERIPFED